MGRASVRWAAAMMFVFVGIAAREARAQDVAPEVDQENIERTEWIRVELEHHQPGAFRWNYGWGIVNSGAAVGQAGGAIAFQLLTSTPAERWGWVPGFGVGAIVGAVAALPQFVFPLTSASASFTLRAAPANTPTERAARRALAERLLRESAEGERFGVSWISHLIGIGVGLVNAGAVWGWVAALGAPLDTQLVQAGISLGFSVIAAEIQILTQPTSSIDSWRIYQRGFPCCRRGVPASPSARAQPVFFPGGAGVHLAF